MGNYLNGDKIYPTLKSIISVALVYFLLAQLSVQISSVTDYTQLLSLNSGFALAAMLVMAHSSALIGITLGALSLSIYRVLEIDTVDASIHLFIPVFIATVQAYINLKIYRHWVSVDNNLSYDNDLFRMLKMVPVIAGVNTIFTIFIPQWLELAHQEIFISVWLKIWIGHTAGMLLVIPVVLSLVEHKDPLWVRRKKILAFNFTVSLLLIFLVCSNIRIYENSRLVDRFITLTDQTTALFQTSLNEKQLLQASVAQFFISSQEVTRAEFKQFVTGLSTQNKYIQVVEWLPKIKNEQRSNYEKLQSEYYGEGFSITEVQAKGIIIPATKRDVYYPITYLEPEWDNNLAQGFDPSASSAGKALIMKAIISGEAQARGPVQILRDSGFIDAFIVYKPIYTNRDGTKTLDPTGSEISGFINIVVRVEDFIATIISSRERGKFTLQWQDIETGKYYFDNTEQESAAFKNVIDFNLSGRNMKLIFTPTKTFIGQAASELTTIVMLTSFILAGLFSMLMLSMTALNVRITSEVELRTKELEDANKKLELLSNKDGLTNLFNRRYFEDALQDEFKRSLRYKSTFALIMFDIDDFKKINDQYGHPCGDQVIKAVANYLIDTSRSSDVLARVGGEEFSLILPAQSETHIMSIVERMRIDISNIKVIYDEHTVQFTCSFGIAIFDQNVKDIHTLVKRADKAMYKAKTTGRNRTNLFSEL